MGPIICNNKISNVKFPLFIIASNYKIDVIKLNNKKPINNTTNNYNLNCYFLTFSASFAAHCNDKENIQKLKFKVLRTVFKQKRGIKSNSHKGNKHKP